MEGRSSTQSGAFFLRLFTYCLGYTQILIKRKFRITKLQQIFRRMRLKKYNFSKRTNFFLWKKVWSFFEKNLFFFKIGRGGKFAVDCASNALFLKNTLSTLIVKFLQKNQKIYKFGKTRKYMKDIFLKKKRFHSFKRHLLKDWRAENMPVVAGRHTISKKRE